MLAKLSRLLFAALSGLFLVFAYPDPDLGWLAPIAIAGVTAAVWHQSLRFGFLAGFVFGFVSFYGQHLWLGVVGADAHVILSIYLALWIGGIGAATAYLSRRIATALVVPIIGALWVFEEALRGRYPFGGYPWSRLAFSQADSPLASWATIGGVPFLGFIVAITGILWVYAFHKRTAKVLVTATLTTAVLIVIPSILPTMGVKTTGKTAILGVIQGGTPQIGMGAMDVRRAVLENHVEETLQMAKDVATGQIKQPDAVIWPENSSDLNPFTDTEAAELIESAANAIGVPIMVGAVVDSFTDPVNEVYNMGIWWVPGTGPTTTYIKNAPVPFGEFIPFRSVLTRFIDRYDRVPRDFAHGTEPGIFEINGMTLGSLICFEVAVDPVVNELISRDVGAIVVQTNNATYAQTALPEQQLAIERLRAIETGREVVVAATTGISAAINPDGAVTQILTDGETGSFTTTVSAVTGMTPGSRFGPYLEIFLGALAAGSLLVMPIRQRFTRNY